MHGAATASVGAKTIEEAADSGAAAVSMGAEAVTLEQQQQL